MESQLSSIMEINPEVNEAILAKKPVVALESTIITHGMEYPTNLAAALAVEEIIRKNGAIPATIAILNGKIKVGLTKSELEELSQCKNAVKTSRRDIAGVLVKKQNGSTTVAATMLVANLAGIKIFVTGGIGGVHRGAESTFDISADLIELGNTPVAVVCAGAKSILDIPKTLEFLETKGVPVVGFKTNKFPEFFVSDSGYKCSCSVENEEEGARLVKMQFEQLQLKTGILFTIPVPKEEEANGVLVKKAIEEAINESNTKGIKGAEITPFLLKRINELTKGDSLKSNVALIKNNAELGAKIAVKLSELNK